ncbi:MAG TPA: SIMPL domain-containing protein [Candidatus Acidoferrales bacterium]|nr:SIMPL domain-containing protein [Candidatus Acidoferrales bacterium]
MFKSCTTLAGIGIAFLVFGSAAFAQSTMPMPMHMPPMMHMPQEISVVASGAAEYVPDVARVSLGVRADSPSAASAIDTINKNTAQVIAAVKALGIPATSIKTVGYNLQYRERQMPVPPAPMNPSMSVNPSAGASAPGTYEASEMLQVNAPVALAGKVLDAALGAGANESFGLSYQTTNYDSLYRSALAKAVASARATADAIAKASHVTLGDVQSISNFSEPQPGRGMAQAGPMAMSGASIMPGSDAVTATVYVVYRIR